MRSLLKHPIQLAKDSEEDKIMQAQPRLDIAKNYQPKEYAEFVPPAIAGALAGGVAAKERSKAKKMERKRKRQLETDAPPKNPKAYKHFA